MRYIIAILGGTLLLFSSCRKEDEVNVVSAEKPYSSLTLNEDAAVRLSYDMVTATFMLPENPADTSNLTLEEKVLATPVYSGEQVNQLIYKNGTIDADIQMMEDEALPEYPVNTIGGERAFSMPEEEKIHRIEVRGGTAHCYNSSGEVVGIGQSNSGNVVYLQTAVQYLADDGLLSDQSFDLVLQGLKQAGFTIEDDEQHAHIAKWTHNRADGGKRILYIDKQLQKITMRLNVSATGAVETISQYAFKASADGKMLPAVHRFITYFDSPFSETRMTIRKVSSFKNFEIEKNL